MAKIKIVFRNKEYESISDMYRNNKHLTTVSLITVHQRIRNGMNAEEALTTLDRVKFGPHIVEGIQFPDLISITKEYGMSTDAVYKRYSRGYRNDDLVPEKKRKSYVDPMTTYDLTKGYFGRVGTRKNVFIEYKLIINGVGYKSEMEACRKLGVNFATYRHRKYRGLTIEQSLGIGLPDKRYGKKKKTSTKSFKPIKVVVKGKEYPSISALARDYNLPIYVVSQRIKNYGYTPEEAVTKKGKGKEVVVNGKKYKSIAALAKNYDTTAELILTYLRTGSTLEQAVGLEKTKGEKRHEVEFKGETYKSIEDLAKKTGISASTIISRRDRGFTLEQAIDLGSERIKTEGRYNTEILERNSELASTNAILYFVAIEINSLRKYKIGITTKTIKERLKGFEFTEIRVYKSTLINCYKLEQRLLKVYSKYKDKEIKSEDLDGYSEILDLPGKHVQNIINVIDKINAFYEN